MTLALEIHDAGLFAVPGGAEPEPGYALLDGNDLAVGLAALDRARLRPRQVHHRFWHDLDVGPLGRPFPRSMSAADLAHAHLDAFWARVGGGVGSVVLALPGAFSERQLGLTLGIARACAIPVEGMVDAALAAAASIAAPEMLVLDVHLHRLVATEVRREDGGLARGRVEVADGIGLAAVRDGLARRFAELFVRATRFDPLHAAEREQELYGRLDGWLADLARAESAEVVFAGRAIETTLGALEPATAVLCERSRELARGAGGRPTLLLSHRLAALPGILRTLGEATVLPPGAAAEGARRVRAAVVAPGEDALPFVIRLPAHVLPREAS
jgi:hypothetical protein